MRTDYMCLMFSLMFISLNFCNNSTRREIITPFKHKKTKARKHDKTGPRQNG